MTYIDRSAAMSKDPKPQPTTKPINPRRDPPVKPQNPQPNGKPH